MFNDNSENIKLEVFSPVFIGTGNEYYCSEFYFIKRKGITKLSRSNLDFIARKLFNLDFELFMDFLDVLKNGDNFKNQRNNEKPRGLHKFLLNSVKTANKNLYFNFLKNSLYECNLCYGNDIEDKYNIGCIKENIKTKNESYIPGSSIKGAIRNSILYSKLNLIDKRNFDVEKLIKTQNKKLDSFMRNLNFTDTFNGIKEPAIYGVESFGTKRNTFTFLETIDRGSILKFKYYNSANPNLDRKTSNYDIDDIFKCVYDFSMDLFDEEINFAEKNGLYDLEDFYNDIYKLNSIERPFIRLGQGSGVLAVSQMLNIKNSRKSLNDFTKFRNDNGIGKFYNYDFPKTKKLIVNSDMPLGWVQLSKDN